MTAALVFAGVYLLIVGWELRGAYDRWTTLRAIKRMLAIDAERRKREAIAREERECCHRVTGAVSDDEAWMAFHVALGIGPKENWP